MLTLKVLHLKVLHLEVCLVIDLWELNSWGLIFAE